MVHFAKPNLLGAWKEFENFFMKPIVNGQYKDSSADEVKLMKEKAYILHRMLEGTVQVHLFAACSECPKSFCFKS
jgi:transcriptional regulator ATRX